VIGVTGPNHGGEAAWLFTRIGVFLAGGHAVRITPRRPHSIEHLDGLIIGGGADVNPTLYGQDLTPIVQKEKHPEQTLTEYLLGWILFPLTFLLRKLAGQSADRGGDAARDALEMTLIDGAVRRSLPILGICRGNQLLNVYFGGSLHQHLDGFYVEDPETRTILPRKRVLVTSGTHLAIGLACDPCTDGAVRVNALHRQAIHSLGHGLRAAARDRNGIVQAVEHETLPFVLGVQWHPEYLPQVRGQRRLFQALVREAKRARERLAKEADPAPTEPSPRRASATLAT
jgi:putative glutamine amidotransferase